MVVVGDGRVLGGSGVVEGRVVSEGQWGFVLVCGEVHDGVCVMGVYRELGWISLLASKSCPFYACLGAPSSLGYRR